MTKNKTDKNIMNRLFQKRETMLGLIVIVLFVILSITNKNFFKWSNLKVIVSGLSVDGSIVIGDRKSVV